ncbi:MAG TPA: NAD(+) kinase [Gammaproteobacteria bacterium]
MSHAFRTVGLWGRLEEPSVADPARQIVAHLHKRGIRVLAASEQAEGSRLRHVEAVPEGELPERCDLIVAVGGDGTLLHAARRAAARNLPLLGINRGRLGFLTDVLPDQMLDAIDALLAGDYAAEQRSMLEADLSPGADGPLRTLALNDVVLQKGETGRMLDFVTYVDGIYVNTHGGDGLIVATPTGSTAYALSCGGPIIQPHVPALVMVPICPHTLSDRPLVLPASVTIEVRVETGRDNPAHVVCDGERLGGIGADDVLRVRLATQTVTLLHPRGYNYYELLRSKLNWGRTNRSGHPPRAG